MVGAFVVALAMVIEVDMLLTFPGFLAAHSVRLPFTPGPCRRAPWLAAVLIFAFEKGRAPGGIASLIPIDRRHVCIAYSNMQSCDHDI